MNVYREVRLTFSSRNVFIRVDGIPPYLMLLALLAAAVDNVCLSSDEPTYGRRATDTKKAQYAYSEEGYPCKQVEAITISWLSWHTNRHDAYFPT